MGWYLNAVGSVLAFTAMFFCFKRLQDTYPIDTYLFYAWLGGAVCFGFLAMRDGVDPELIRNPEIALALGAAGVASWLGNYFYNIGISKQGNLGYVEAVSSIRLAIVYAASLLILGSHFEASRLVALLLAVTGMLFLIGKPINQPKAAQRDWFMWALLSGIMFALLAIANRYVNENGIHPYSALAIWLFIASALYAASAAAKKHSLSLSRDKHIVVLATIFSTLGNAMLFLSYRDAPNLAYPTAISYSRMVLLYVISIVTRADQFRMRSVIGIVLVFASVVLLS